MWTIFTAFLALASSQECSDPNCLACETYSGEEFCSLCSDGLFPSSSQCSICESQPLECDLSSSKWSCFCSSTLSLATFEPNPSLSGHCIAGQPCQICLEGFVYEDGNCLKVYGDSAHGKRTLPTLPYKCVTASTTDPNLCSVCEDGYYSQGGYCTQCYSNCLTCSTQYECTSCTAPLVLETSKKACCVAGCSNCYYGTCLACGAGYTFNNYDCVSGTTCPAECSSCDSTGKCLGCVSGKSYNSVTFTCVDLPYKCVTALATDLSKCSVCESGYFLANEVCYQCYSNCKTCTTQYECSDCNAPLVLEPNGDACCVVGCNNCWYGTCLGCGSGYVLDANNVCVSGVSCPADCSSCDSTGKCLGCNTGKLYDAVGFTCNACPSNCGGCPNGACSVTVTCPTNCNTCDSNGVCTQCNWGYGETTTPDVCSKCDNGYYPGSVGCKQCVSSCTTCDWEEVCTGCVSGLNLVGDYCCSPRCKSCNHLVCHECNPGYDEINGVCENCAVNCGGCPFGICQLTCPTGCSTCTKTTCTACQDGFFMNSLGVCTACNPKCKTCRALNKCTTCFANYYIAITVEKCCLEGCADCNMSNDRCHSCNSGYNYISATRRCVAA